MVFLSLNEKFLLSSRIPPKKTFSISSSKQLWEDLRNPLKSNSKTQPMVFGIVDSIVLIDLSQQITN